MLFKKLRKEKPPMHMSNNMTALHGDAFGKAIARFYLLLIFWK